MNIVELIEATTDAVTTPAEASINGSDVPVTIHAEGLAGVETVQLKVRNGGAYVDVYQDGHLLRLTATQNVLSINSPMELGVTKSATVAAVGVYLTYGQSRSGKL